MATKKEPVRLGIIGSGLAVKWLHVPAFKRLPGQFEIVVTCDTNEKAAQDVARIAVDELGSPNCKWTTDYKEVLANEAVEAVLLSLPIHLNSQFMLDAARAGKHIICEKPLAANMPQAQELVRTLKEFNGLVIEIAENFHYREDFKKAQEWIKAGRIGELFLIEMRAFFWTDIKQGFGSTPWRQDNQYRGGPLADGGVHHAAALRELGGEVEQLQAFAKSVHPVMGGQDMVVVNLRFRNGALGSLLFAGAVKSDHGSFVEVGVFGTEGSIFLDGQGKVQLKQNDENNAHLAEEWVAPEFDNGYGAEFDNFYRAVRYGEPVICTPEAALRDWEIVMYALDAAESRQVILF